MTNAQLELMEKLGSNKIVTRGAEILVKGVHKVRSALSPRYRKAVANEESRRKFLSKLNIRRRAEEAAKDIYG